MALTWRNVDAPDFGRSMEGIRSFADMFSNAVSGLDRGLVTYDGAIDKRVNNDVLMQLAAAGDADAARGIVSSLALRPDARRISAPTIQAASGRVGDLLSQALVETQGKQAEYRFGEEKREDAADLNAAKYVDKYLTTGEAPEGAFNGLGLRDRIGLTTGRQGYVTGEVGIESSRLGMDNTRQNMKQGATRFGWEGEDREFGQQAEKIAGELQRYGMGEDAEAALNAMDLDPRLYGAVRQRMGFGGPLAAGDMISSAIGAGGGGTNTGDPTRIMNYEARAVGINAVPENVRTLGQASDFARQVNARGAKSSAMGTYQIVGTTLRSYAPKVFGENWQSVDYNGANQDKIAEAIFNDHRGSASALSKQWVSLSPAEAERVRKMPWAQAREVIARKESGAQDAASLAMGSAIAAQGGRNASMARNANNINSTYAKFSQDNRPVAEVASGLAGKGSFAGLNQGQLTEQIRLVQSAARREGKTINAMVAADILRNSMSSSAWSRQMPAILGGGDSAGMYIDQNLVREAVKNYSEGGVDRAVVADADMQIQAAVQQQAQAQLQQAQSNLVRARALAARGQRVDLQRYVQEYEAANVMVQEAIAGTASRGTFMSGSGSRPRRTSGSQPTRARPSEAIRRAIQDQSPRNMK